MKFTYLKLVLVIGSLIFLYNGCDDSGLIADPPKGDSVHYNVRNLIISENLSSASYNSVNFYQGFIVQEVNSNRDAILCGGYIDTTAIKYFCFRSGVISSYVLGFETKFIKNLFSDATQFQFDTMKVIPDSDTLNCHDFLSDSTGFFTDSIPTRPIFGFYLSGRYKSGVTDNPVYGILYVDSLWKTEEGISQFRIDIKTNRAGKNEFR